MPLTLMWPDPLADHAAAEKNRAEQERQLAATVGTQSLEAIENLVIAARQPAISSSYLEAAIKCAALALEAARELDK